MAIKTEAQRNTLANAYGAAAKQGALYITSPGATAGTEPGGSYSKQPLTWSAASGSVIEATATFTVPAGATIVGQGVHAADGTYLDGGDVTSQNFATEGTTTVTFIYTQA